MKKYCERCDGLGEVPAAWPIFRLHLEELSANMDPGRERFYALWKEYKRWKRDRTVPCLTCNRKD